MIPNFCRELIIENERNERMEEENRINMISPGV